MVGVRVGLGQDLGNKAFEDKIYVGIGFKVTSRVEMRTEMGFRVGAKVQIGQIPG